MADIGKSLKDTYENSSNVATNDVHMKSKRKSKTYLMQQPNLDTNNKNTGTNWTVASENVKTKLENWRHWYSFGKIIGERLYSIMLHNCRII